MCDERQLGFLRCLVSLLVLCISACGAPPSTSESSNPVQAGCEHRFAVQCHGVFTCHDTAFLLANADVIGSSEDECSMMTASMACAADCGDKVYDASADMQCADQLAAQSCEDVNNGLIPAPCFAVCVSKSAASSGQGGSSVAP